MEDKVNYQNMALIELELIKQRLVKPQLLLHACCGPCAVYPLIFLNEYFSITILFNNSNIYPQEEYQRRLNELIKVQDNLLKDYGVAIKLIEFPYDNENYNVDLEPYADFPEGGKRCYICFSKRMHEGYKYASENGYEYYTTVMTISRQKNSQIINQIGAKLQKEFMNVKYFHSDFKKNNGLLLAREFRMKYDLYQQLYCGCKYSFFVRKEKEIK